MVPPSSWSSGLNCGIRRKWLGHPALSYPRRALSIPILRVLPQLLLELHRFAEDVRDVCDTGALPAEKSRIPGEFEQFLRAFPDLMFRPIAESF